MARDNEPLYLEDFGHTDAAASAKVRLTSAFLRHRLFSILLAYLLLLHDTFHSLPDSFYVPRAIAQANLQIHSSIDLLEDKIASLVGASGANADMYLGTLLSIEDTRVRL